METTAIVGCCVKGVDIVGDEFVDGIFGDIVKPFKKIGKAIGKAAKAVVKSPISKVVAGGLTFVIPPAGLAASAGLVAAGKVVDAVDAAKRVKDAARKAAAMGKKINPVAAKKLLQQSTFAKKLVAQTARAAKMGDRDAKRGLAALLAARRAKSRVKPVSAKAIPRLKPPKMQTVKKKITKPTYVVMKGGKIRKGKFRKGSGSKAVSGFLVAAGAKPVKGSFVG